MSDQPQVKDVVKTHFHTDEAVQMWEKVYRDSEDFFAYSMSARKATVLDLLRKDIPAKGPKLADIGCGSGLVSKDLMAMGYDVTGMDISEGMLENARKIPGLKLQIGDIENLPFASESFDKAICLGVISYLPNEAKALAELHRILKPGGKLVLAVRNKLECSVLFDPILMLKKIFSAFRKRVAPSSATTTPEGYYHRNFIPWRLDANLRQTGFVTGESRGCGYDYPTFNKHRFTSVRAGMRFSRWLEQISQKPGLRFLRNWGMVYIVVATRPGTAK